MKKIHLFLSAAIIALCSMPSVAQFRVGPRLGVEVNSMKFDKDVFNSDNRAGFTGGIMAEFTIPVINLGLDASVMYVHRENKSTTTDEGFSWVNAKNFTKRDYLEIPVNVKYKIGIPAVSNIIAPYIFTGPSFSVLLSGKSIAEGVMNKKCDVAWNLGVGLQLFNHLQVGASYGWGLSDSIVTDMIGVNSTNQIDGKNNYWTVTAAYLF